MTSITEDQAERGQAAVSGGRMNSRQGLWSTDFSLLYLTSLASFLGFQVLVPTLPLFLKGLGGQDAEVGLLLGIFSGAALAARLLVGRALDQWGRKRPLVVGVLLVLVAMLLYYLTTSIPLLMLSRCFHGIGFGIVTTAGPAIGADVAPRSRRGEAMGFLGNAQSIATGVGPVLGLWLLGAGPLPLHGFSLLFAVCGAVAGLQLLSALAIGESNQSEAVDSAPKGRSSDFFSRRALPTAIVMFFAAFAFGAVLSYAPIYLSAESTQTLSIFFLVNAVVTTVALPICGTLADRVGRQAVAVPLMIIWPVGVATLAISPTLPVAIVSGVLGGLGFGALMPTLTAHVMDVVKPEERGAAMATFMAAVDIGIAAGSMLLGIVVQVSGFPAMFLGASGVAALGLIAFLANSRPTNRVSQVGGTR